MAKLIPFRGLRPVGELADKVASLPYDVVDTEEAREMAKGNPFSFLHVIKPEIDLQQDVNLYDPIVYEKGKENLNSLITNKSLIRDETPCFYVYKQCMGEHEQIGLVACASVDEYLSGKIKKLDLSLPSMSFQV